MLVAVEDEKAVLVIQRDADVGGELVALPGELRVTGVYEAHDPEDET